MPYLTDEQIYMIGFKSVGKNVNISDKCSIYNASNIEIGNNVRIDDFSVLSAGDGGIKIGNFVHISLYVSIQGSGKTTISDFCGLAPKVSIMSTSEDYTEGYMTNPVVRSINPNLTKTYTTDIFIGKHCIIGMNSILLPNSYLCDGISIGAMSMVKINLNKPGVYVGIPVKFLYPKKTTKYIEFEEELNQMIANN